MSEYAEVLEQFPVTVQPMIEMFLNELAFNGGDADMTYRSLDITGARLITELGRLAEPKVTIDDLKPGVRYMTNWGERLVTDIMKETSEGRQFRIISPKTGTYQLYVSSSLVSDLNNPDMPLWYIIEDDDDDE